MTDLPAVKEQQKTASHRVAVVVVAIGLVALVLVLVGRFGVDPYVVDSPLVGKPVAPLVLVSLKGNDPIVFEELRGEVLVVNFWASWCLACRGEHPHLMAVSEEYRARGVQFIGIVYQDTPARAIAFLDEMGWGDDFLYAVDEGTRAGIEFGVYAIPETFIVDREGMIVERIIGPVTGASLTVALNGAMR